MTDERSPQWPPRWRLTAPESHVLEHRGGANADVPFRLAVKELAARGVLRADPIEGAWLRGPSVSYMLSDGPRVDGEVPPVLAPVLAAYAGARRRSKRRLRDGETVSGVPLRDLLKSGAKQLGGTERYLDLHVGPALVEQGLLDQIGTRGARRRPSFDWTDAGRAAEQVLEEWLALGRRNLGRWSTSDPTGGAQFVSLAGSALLLLDGYQPELARLGQRIQTVGGAFAADGMASSGDPDGPTEDQTTGGLASLDLTSVTDFATVSAGIGDVGGSAGGGGS